MVNIKDKIEKKFSKRTTIKYINSLCLSRGKLECFRPLNSNLFFCRVGEGAGDHAGTLTADRGAPQVMVIPVVFVTDLGTPKRVIARRFEGSEGTMVHTLQTTPILLVEAERSPGPSGRLERKGCEDAAQASAASFLGNEEVVKAEIPEAGNVGHMLVRPVAREGQSIVVVGRWEGDRRIARPLEVLSEKLAQLYDQGVGGHIRLCPRFRTELSSPVASGNSFVEGDEKGDH